MPTTTIQMDAAAYVKHGVWEQGRTTTEWADTFKRLGGTACKVTPGNGEVTVTITGTDEAVAYVTECVAANQR
jgi:hypothetical protein